jgi:hypothetical protein
VLTPSGCSDRNAPATVHGVPTQGGRKARGEALRGPAGEAGATVVIATRTSPHGPSPGIHPRRLVMISMIRRLMNRAHRCGAPMSDGELDYSWGGAELPHWGGAMGPPDWGRRAQSRRPCHEYPGRPRICGKERMSAPAVATDPPQRRTWSMPYCRAKATADSPLPVLSKNRGAVRSTVSLCVINPGFTSVTP